MADYDILLLDEPFNGLDDTTKDKVIKYIKEKTVHKTVLLVTHNNDEADYFK
jgi:NitT/TauT family transport system ATP-binding protein